MAYLRFSVTAAFATMMLAGCANAQSKTRTPAAAAPVTQQAGAANQGGDIRITITTTKGEIQATLYASKVPMTVANFVNLAQKKYYDGIIFHRVIPDFMAQVGDPLTRDPRMERRWGTGGPGYTFADEIDRSLKHSRPGIFSMANSGPNTNGSQIFITHVPTPHLDGKHAVFGSVTKGMDVLLAITKGDKIVEVKVLDDTSALLMSQAEHVKKWNMALEGPNRDF